MKQGKHLKILKSKGFYLSLLTGILAIAAICFVYFNTVDKNQQKGVKDLNNNTSQSLVKDEKKDTTNVTKSTAEPSATADVKTNAETIKNDDLLENDIVSDPNVVAKEKAKNEKTAKSKKEDSVAVVNQKKSKTKLSFNQEDELQWPVQGNVIIPYDVEHGVQFLTLGQYKTSNAIVIASKVGADVKCSADAKVTSITKNEETGTTVKMDIGDGYSLVYGQLTDLKVKKGDTVKAGSVIGKVAEPTKYYVVEGPNVYMQVLQDDQTVNPMYLLK